MSSTPPPASPTSVTPASDEPGWFGDGAGDQRYWDGSRWTELVSGRRVFPGRASSTPEPRLVTESPLPADYAAGSSASVAAPSPSAAGDPAPAAPGPSAAGDPAPFAPAASDAPPAPPTGSPVAPPAGYPLAPPTGAPVAPPTGSPPVPPSASPAAPTPHLPAPPRPATSAASAAALQRTAPVRGTRSTWPWAALAIAAVLVVAAAIVAGLPGLLIALGVVALVAGLVPLVRRGAAWIPGIRSRATGGLAAGVAVALIAGGTIAATRPDADPDVIADPDAIEISDARPVPEATEPANPLPVSADGLVEMIDVTRMRAVDAGDTLAASGFGIAFADVAGSALVRQDVWIVARQDPAAGTRVAPGAVVTLTLAAPAPERIGLPIVPRQPDIPSRTPSRPGTQPGGGSGNGGGGGGGGGGSGSGSDGGTDNDPAPPPDPQPTPAPEPTSEPVDPGPVDPPPPTTAPEPVPSEQPPTEPGEPDPEPTSDPAPTEAPVEPAPEG